MNFLHTNTQYILTTMKLINFCSVLDIAIEKAPQEAASYDHEKLKHVDAEEKNVLPTSSGALFINQS